MNEEQMSVARSLSTWTRSWWGWARRTIAVATAVTMAAAITDPVAAAECRADIDDNGQVNGADLATILSAWGQPGPTDLDGNGFTDAADLAVVLAGWGRCPNPSPTSFSGIVVLADGKPFSGAVVVSDLGGTVTTAIGGAYELELLLAEPVESVRLTAMATIDGANYRGTTVVTPVVWRGSNEVKTIVMSPASSCEGSYAWLPGFASPGMNDWVLSLAVFDDGHGPALYAGGQFGIAGGPAGFIAKWDGSEWSPVGGGLEAQLGSTAGFVAAMTVFDDGSGPALYVGGAFSKRIDSTPVCNLLKWNGRSWSELGLNCFGGVNALTVFDDGNGPALFAGGLIGINGGFAPVWRIAKWDGAGWHDLGQANGTARAFAEFDAGDGPRLYVGGEFTLIGDVPASNVAMWDGKAWSAVGGGVGGTGTRFVRRLQVFDDGTGSALYAGGLFNIMGAGEARSIARWDGSTWSPLDIGVSGYVSALSVFDDGSGPALYVGGSFSHAGDVPARNIARWTDAGWESLSGWPDSVVWVLSPLEVAGGTRLFAGGDFRSAGGNAANRIAAWDGVGWSAIGGLGMGGQNYSTQTQVYTLAVFDDGGGEALYAGGTFLSAGHAIVKGIARWDGQAWSPLGEGFGEGTRVNALAVFDDGKGPKLYVGGNFSSVSGVAANFVARWDGTTWSALGSGLNGTVRSLAVFDDGGGPALYVGGEFTTAGGVNASRIARWDAAGWSALGTGVSASASGGFASVFAIASFDDGTGHALFVGGWFNIAGGQPAAHIAKWNGAQWTPLGSGIEGEFSPAVYALQVWDDGSGEGLYAGGRFSMAGGTTARSLAKWDGNVWSPVGDDLLMTSACGTVYTLEVFDEGVGRALYAGGSFSPECGNGHAHMARWDGSSWFGLGTGMSAPVHCLATFDDGSGPSLFAGGDFYRAGDVNSVGIAKWGCID